MTGVVPPTIDQPGHRSSAPGGLGLVQAFLNTVDIEGGTDEFADLEGLTRWLRAAGLLAPGATPSERERRRAVVVREALRSLIEARDSGRRAGAAADILEQCARRAPLVVRLAEAGAPTLEPQAEGLDAAIARILGEAVRAGAQGNWQRLKICRNDACRWSFYDASRNRSGVWCTMAVCGNRRKLQSFRARRRGGKTRG
jgi:predicted RNA-binding Zn ribbon-like protein